MTLSDEQRTSGRFILTGSGNVLLTPSLADSLAGRVDILRRHPLSHCETARRIKSMLRRAPIVEGSKNDAIAAPRVRRRRSRSVDASRTERYEGADELRIREALRG